MSSNPNDPAPYGQAYTQNAPVQGPAKTNVLSIIALIGGIVFAPVGIICGIISLKQINRTGEAGRGMAKAGLIIGIIFFILWLAYVIFVIVFALNTASEMNTTGY